jgi:sortase A
MRTALHVFGEVLITLGLVLLLFAGYQLWGTGLYTHQAQKEMVGALQADWSAKTPVQGSGPTGDAVALIRIPRLGPTWQQAVVDDVDPLSLRRGPGHYPGTADFGEIGNAVVSGHRTGHGAPFRRLDEIKVGDEIIVETRDNVFTYRMTGREVVEPTDLEVVLPVPGEPGATPTEALLTLTTCHPPFSASQRLIIYSELASTVAKRPAPAAAATG